MNTSFDYTRIEIPALDTEAMNVCRKRIDNLCKPIYSLAQLEVMAERLAGITGMHKPNHLRSGLVIFAADHEVNGNAVTMEESDCSYAELMRMAAGNSATDAVARKLQASVTLVDMGLMHSTNNLQNIRHFDRLMDMSDTDTSHFSTIERVQASIQVGYELAKEMSAEGIHIVGIGNIGAGALSVADAITNMMVANYNDKNSTNYDGTPNSEALFASLGEYHAYDIAAMVGFVLGAAEARMAIVIDNIVTGVAAMIASTLQVGVKEYVFASAVYTTDTHRAQMDYLGLRSYLYYDFTIASGLGSAMGISLLDASLHMLNDMKTFTEAAVAVAEDGPGNGVQILEK